MDFSAFLKWIPIAIQLFNAVRSTVSNSDLSNAIKDIVPADQYNAWQAAAKRIFDSVDPALQVAAAVSVAVDPDKNKTIQGLLNIANAKMSLGLPNLVVDGVYGAKTREMAAAVQKKLGGDVVVDGWFGMLSLAALEIWMKK